MPNTGKPSLACHTCRAKRIKCDLTRPGCLKCKGRCPGYRDPDDGFRNKSLASFPRATGTSKSILQLSPKLAEQWEAHACPLVLDQLSTPIDGYRFRGILHFLPDVFREAGEKSCLHLTVNAVFLTYMARREPNFSMKTAAKAYGKALRSLNAALKGRSTHLQDSTLVAIWLLGINDYIHGSPIRTIKPGPCAWLAHLNGVTTLLRLRGNAQFKTGTGCNLFWMTYSSVQAGCLAANVPCPRETAEWMSALRSNPTDIEERFITIAEYNSNAAYLCWRIQQAIACNDADVLAFTLPALLDDVDTIEDDLLTWKQHHEYPPTVTSDKYHRIYIWNMYRATRAKMLQLIVKLLNHIERFPVPMPTLPPLEHRRQACVLTSQAMFQEIIESAPTALGEPESKPLDQALAESRRLCWDDVFRVFAPMKIVWFSELALPHQKELACIGLQRIVDELGNRHAMILPPYVEMSTATYSLGCTRDNCLLHNRSTSEVPSV